MFDDAIGCMEFCCAAFAALAFCRVGLRIILVGLRMIEHLGHDAATSPRRGELSARPAAPASWVDQRRAA